MKRKNTLLLLAASGLLATSAISACHSSGAAAGPVTPTARVAAAQRGDISHVLTLAGQFQPYQVVDVHPKVSGYMKKINVDIGDLVKQGETLAILEVPELKAQLEQSGFEVKQSQEEITRAQREIQRTEAVNSALHAASERLKAAAATRPGLIAQQELDDAQSKDLSSQAQTDAAKSAMAAAQQHEAAAKANNEQVQAMLDYTNVVAPISGVVIWRYADTGALIQGGTNSNDQALPIVRLSQSNLLRLRIPVPEDDVKFIHDGDQLAGSRGRDRPLVYGKDRALYARREFRNPDMPVDLFPKIDMPVVVVATFYNGMPPQQIEADITNTFERFFTLGANIDHSESRSLTGVSLIKIYFKPGTDPNAALSNIANLAMADLRRLPPGTLPPVVLGMDASTQPVCLVTLKGRG
jgi:multidrug efflux pump subunit AcrA (membrane-fusion protein)